MGDAPASQICACRTFKIGRGASRKECDAERRTIVESIVAHNYSVGMPCRTIVEVIVPQRGNESQW
ncbi:DUF1534 domain-containing protein, partial [Pseudomonas syringae pv. actinidiae]|nr:DUF1534 domain-containing protein [Pseudomonas syringae pv. actinidiae]